MSAISMTASESDSTTVKYLLVQKIANFSSLINFFRPTPDFLFVLLPAMQAVISGKFPVAVKMSPNWCEKYNFN